MANRFYENRMAIKVISEKEGVDVDIASRMYAQQQGWTGWEKEMVQAFILPNPVLLILLPRSEEHTSELQSRI